MHEDDPNSSPTQTPQESRRDFLKVISVGGIGAGVVGASLVPASGMVIYPLLQETTRGTNQLVTVGPADLFKEGEPLKVDLYADKTDAWNRVTDVKIGSAWVIREGEKLTAYSTVCPHLGCSIGWEAEQKKFFCPCHKALFSKDGQVESGPSPRGMDELEIKRGEKGLISIQHQRFKTGSKTKEPA